MNILQICYLVNRADCLVIFYFLFFHIFKQTVEESVVFLIFIDHQICFWRSLFFVLRIWWWGYLFRILNCRVWRDIIIICWRNLFYLLKIYLFDLLRLLWNIDRLRSVWFLIILCFVIFIGIIFENLLELFFQYFLFFRSELIW